MNEEAVARAMVAAHDRDWEQLTNEGDRDYWRALAKAALAAMPAQGWRDIASAPRAMHVLACRFDEAVGEWVYAVVLSPPPHPFTAWQPLPAPPEKK